MALQDLTPQLRTRLNRMERAVGWFVLIATALLLFGFGYYLYKVAERKGWFLKKITYQTCVSSVTGLKEGDPVRMMGKNVGEITEMVLNDPYAYYNVTIYFRVILNRDKYPGYIWSDSKVKVNSSDFLGGRYLEITKGVAGVPTVYETTNNAAAGILKREMELSKIPQQKFNELKSQQPDKSPPDLWADVWTALKMDSQTHPATYYTNNFRDNIFFLEPLESPAVSDRLEKLANQVETALPNILNLTNKLASILDHTANLTSNLNNIALDAKPAASNLAYITEQLRGPGSLGTWLLNTNGAQNLDSTLASADSLMSNTDTNLAALLDNLGRSLDNLADITSNLNSQVQSNTNMLGSISKAVVDADDLVQGLKRHWLLRSAFKTKATNAPPAKTTSPKGK